MIELLYHNSPLLSNIKFNCRNKNFIYANIILIYLFNLCKRQNVSQNRSAFSLLTAYQFLTSPNSKLRFHFLDQRFKFYLAFFLAIGVDIACDALAVDSRSVSSFPHVLADLVD